MLPVLPVTVTTVVQVALSVLSWMLKSRVLYVVDSPPAPACFTTKPVTLAFPPRSTCSQRVAAAEQNLSLLPPLTLPFTAFSGPSVVAHAALPVAALFSARFAPEGVGAVVGVGGG